MMKSYDELIALAEFEERLRYALIHYDTSDRRVKQMLYATPEWKKVRREAIIRDECRDLAIPDRDIFGVAYVHHLNPITAEDVIDRNPRIFDLNNLITVSKETHEAIHRGDMGLALPSKPLERVEFDTCPWKRKA